jgi:ADP-ribose pyrophosphatase YjhB (NUDIX family)
MGTPLRRRATALVPWQQQGQRGMIVRADREGYWLLPGGGVRRQEPLLASAARGLAEATGLDAFAGLFLFTERGSYNEHHVFLMRAGGALRLTAPYEVPAIGLCRPDLTVVPILAQPDFTTHGLRLLNAAARIIEGYAAISTHRPVMAHFMAALDLADDDSRLAIAALRSDWRTLPLSEKRTDLTIARRYSADEMARIRCGFIPQEMEDKWFAYVEEDTLYLHRSWTGIQIYQVTFAPVGEEYVVARAVATRDPEQYKQQDDHADAQTLEAVISMLLLRRYAGIPAPGGLTPDLAALHSWSVMGQAMFPSPPGDGSPEHKE